MTFTLWNEKARTFNTDAYEDAAKPTIMVVSSCWVKTYGGNFVSINKHEKRIENTFFNVMYDLQGCSFQAAPQPTTISIRIFQKQITYSACKLLPN